MKLIYKLVEVAEQFGQRSDENAVLIRNQSQAIKDAVKVRIQPVADYLYMETDQENFHIERDFPNLTPLWQLACYVWSVPRFFRSDGQILPNPVGVEQVELVCLAAAKPYDKPPVQIAYNFMLWSWHPNFPNRINQVVMVIAVNRDGQVCDLEPNAARDHYRYASGATDHWPNEQPHPLESLPSEYTSTLPSLLYPVLLATSLCNDLRAKVERIATPPKLMRQQVRRHGWAPECWHDIRMNAGSS